MGGGYGKNRGPTNRFAKLAGARKMTKEVGKQDATMQLLSKKGIGSRRRQAAAANRPKYSKVAVLAKPSLARDGKGERTGHRRGKSTRQPVKTVGEAVCPTRFCLKSGSPGR